MLSEITDTMKPFPEEYELITLFELEPILLDDVVPWYYNFISFKLSRNTINLTIGIEPAGNRVNLRLGNDIQGTLVELSYESIIGMEVYKDNFSEGLLIILNEDDPNVTIRIETKPNIRLLSNRDKNFRK